jgi:hypothetical protein
MTPCIAIPSATIHGAMAILHMSQNIGHGIGFGSLIPDAPQTRQNARHSILWPLDGDYTPVRF